MGKIKRLIIQAVLSFFILFSIPNNSISFENADELIKSLDRITGDNGKMEQRIASSLQKVGKNLVLENTRGANEIKIYKKISPAVVCVLTEESLGSGSIINTKGHVITNWHVVQGNPKVVVVFKPKNSAELKKELAFTARVIKVDKVSDLALLKIINPPRRFAHLNLGTSSSLDVGQDVHAIGHPSGEIWTYTKGFISQIRPKYKWQAEEGFVHNAKIIQTQTPINPGSSGGPLLDNSGKLIGVNSFAVEGEGLNYAVAVDEIRKLLGKKAVQKAKKKKKPIQKTQIKQSQNEPKCNEAYDTTGAGWDNVLGCYYSPSAKQPDLWLVFDTPDDPASSAALDTKGIGRIDMVVVTDSRYKRDLWYVDTNCDGKVDVIGIQLEGEKDISQYKRPIGSIYLYEKADVFSAALKKRLIPYPNLRFCR